MGILLIQLYMILFQISKDLTVKAYLKFPDEITFLTTLLRLLYNLVYICGVQLPILISICIV